MTRFQKNQLVRASKQAQGLITGETYRVLDVNESQTAFGNFVTYVLFGPRFDDAAQLGTFAVVNGHLLLTDATPPEPVRENNPREPDPQSPVRWRVLKMTARKMKLADVRVQLRSVNMTIRKSCDGEYGVKPLGAGWESSAVYFTDDLKDALDTGLTIARNLAALEASGKEID